MPLERITLDQQSLPRPALPVPLPEAQTPHRGLRPVQREHEATYQQLYRVAHDLRVVVTERNDALRAAYRAQREAARRLMLIAARREAGGLEHCLRVGAISALLGKLLGKPSDWCDRLFEAAPLHDIGNIAIPDAILYKVGRLSAREWKIVRDHPIAGARLLAGTSSAIESLAADVALNHHEKWDGSGYPARRSGTNIPFAARIVAVADFVDSLGLTSSYRAGLPLDTVFALLEQASGAQFEPGIVRAMHTLQPLLGEIAERAHDCAVRFPLDSSYEPWWETVLK